MSRYFKIFRNFWNVLEFLQYFRIVWNFRFFFLWNCVLHFSYAKLCKFFVHLFFTRNYLQLFRTRFSRATFKKFFKKISKNHEKFFKKATICNSFANFSYTSFFYVHLFATLLQFIPALLLHLQHFLTFLCTSFSMCNYLQLFCSPFFTCN